MLLTNIKYYLFNLNDNRLTVINKYYLILLIFSILMRKNP